MKSTESSVQNIYTLDSHVPLAQAVPFGLQHILAMFVANIAPIIIVTGACGLDASHSAMLIQCAMIIAGIGTLIQLFPIWKIGSGLPIVMGISFTFVSVFCYVGPAYGYPAIVGAVLVGGLIEGILGLFAKYWMKLITPIVSASVVTSIGFSLLSVGAASFGGGSGSENFGAPSNWILGTVTLICCLLFHIFAKSYFKQLSVLFGLIVGYILAIFMGVVDFSALQGVSVVALPSFLPFKPEFDLNAIIAVTLIFLVSATETIGDTDRIDHLRWFREFDLRTVRMSSDHVLQPEHRSRRNDKSRKPLCDCDGCYYHDHCRHLPGCGCTSCNAPGCGSRRLHDHDVRNDRHEWNPDDEPLRLQPEKHHDRLGFSECRNRIYSGTGALRDLPADHPHRVCRKLRCRCLPRIRHSEPGSAG